MDTSCKECVFAEWDGIQQTQCRLDRLEKFTERGTEVVEEEEPGTGRKYFKILGRICNTCRHPSALEGVPARKWRQKVESEVQVRVSFLILIGPDDELSDVQATFDSIASQYANRAFEVVFVRNRSEVSDFDICTMVDGPDPTPWRIVRVDGVVRPDNTYDPNPTPGDIVDEAVADCQSTFYTVAKSGYAYQENFLHDIENAINVELVPFVALLPDEDGNGGVVQVTLHKALKGNRPMFGFTNVFEKIEDIARQEETEYMIKTFEEIRSP